MWTLASTGASFCRISSAAPCRLVSSAISDRRTYGQCATPNLRIYDRVVVHADVRGRAGSGAIMADTARQVHPDAGTGQRGRYWRPITGGPADQDMGPADRNREPTRGRRHPGDQYLRQRPG